MSKASIILPAAAGIVAGIVSSLLMATRDSPARVEPPIAKSEAPSQAREYGPIVVIPSQDPVEEVRRRSEQASAPTPRANDSVRARAPDESMLHEEQKRATEARHEQAIRAHRQEPIDPSWSRKTTELVQSDLNELAKSASFKVVETECRMTSCLGTVEWSSYGKAQSEWRKLLHHSYQANCSREITLPEPKDQTASYQATIVLDCESFRADSR